MGLIDELKRRNVFRVGAAYAVVAWVLLQVADTMVPALRLPESVQSVVVLLLLLGFPMMIPLIAGAFIGVIELFGSVDKAEFMVQQMLGGIRPASLIAVPMFIPR